MKKEMKLSRFLTGFCIILAVMGLSAGTVGATTVTQTTYNGTCLYQGIGTGTIAQGSLSANSDGSAGIKTASMGSVTGNVTGPFIVISNNVTRLSQAAEKLGVTEAGTCNRT